MTRASLTLDRIDELLAFLPSFNAPDRAYVKEWASGGRKGHIPYPIYKDNVQAFFRLAGMPWWSDRDYEPGRARRMLEDDDFVQTCSLDEIRTMLTYCVRAERFGDGLWEYVLRHGHIQALLRRLAVLRDDLAFEARDERREQPRRGGER